MTKPTRARRRRRWGWRRVHKWIGVTGGTLLVIWIVSGMVISWPAGARARLQVDPPAPDYTAVGISPAEALETIAARGVPVERGSSVRLVQLGSRAAYLVRAPGTGVSLLDASTGAAIEVDGREAVRIASENYGGPGRPGEPVLVESRTLRYPQGELPAYRIEFDDRFNTEIYVAVRTGAAMLWDTKSRTRRWMGSFHDLWPIGPVLGRRARLVGMIGGGLLTLVVCLTGYWLAWRRGGWKWPKRRPDPSPTAAE